MRFHKSVFALALLGLLFITPFAYADDVSIHYSSELQVGDRFEWESHNIIRDLETNTNTSHQFNIEKAEIVNELAGVEATPITYYNDYFNVTSNGTQLSAIGNYFYYQIFMGARPYIAPAQTEESQRFFSHLNENKPDNNWTIETNFQITEIYYNGLGNQFQNRTLYYKYETQSGVLLRYESISILQPNSEYITTVDLIKAPFYVQMEENIQNTGEPVTDEVGNTDAPLHFNLLIYGMIILFPLIVQLRTRNATQRDTS